MEATHSADWITRCARRIGELDGSIDDDESLNLARDLEQFERTRVMAPEAAVDLVAEVIGHPGGPRLERRLVPRTAGAEPAR